jgi:hypothetical protein
MPLLFKKARRWRRWWGYNWLHLLLIRVVDVDVVVVVVMGYILYGHVKKSETIHSLL